MAAALKQLRGLSRRAFLAIQAATLSSAALGRTPYGGRLRLTVPWPITSVDPASLTDGFSALFSGALFEPLYAADAAGSPYPTLAEALPTKQRDGCRVKLRPGLETATGRALAGADVVATLARARARGAVGLLGDIEAPTLDPRDPLSVSFAKADPELVARTLASPLLALVPRGFSPVSPDGCGPFKIELGGGRALLTRNERAARGPAFLDAIEVSSAPDLADLLRGFEVGQTDVGWFGSGLYRAVKDATAFAAPRYGFAVLMAGRAAGAWGAPGTLQGLLDAIPAAQLSHLGLRGLPAQALGSPAWGGPATSIAVLRGAPQLIAVARAVAASLSTPGHELTVLEKSAEELTSLQSTRQFGLLVDCVRAASAAPRELELSLRSAASPETARRAPKTAPVAPRDLGRQLTLGVIGDLMVWGARRASFVGIEPWQLGSVFVRPSS